MTRQEIYDLIDGEREYQKRMWPKGEERRGVLGGIALLEDYLHQFNSHYQQEEDALGKDVPIDCLHDIRKMAAILVRIMEYNDIPPRQ